MDLSRKCNSLKMKIMLIEWVYLKLSILKIFHTMIDAKIVYTKSTKSSKVKVTIKRSSRENKNTHDF